MPGGRGDVQTQRPRAETGEAQPQKRSVGRLQPGLQYPVRNQKASGMTAYANASWSARNRSEDFTRTADLTAHVRGSGGMMHLAVPRATKDELYAVHLKSPWSQRDGAFRSAVEGAEKKQKKSDCLQTMPEIRGVPGSIQASTCAFSLLSLDK